MAASEKGFSVSEWIDRAPGDVWTYMTDFDHAPDWMPGVEGIARADEIDAPPALGVRYDLALSTSGRAGNAVTEVTLWEPAQRFGLTSENGPVTATYIYSLAPEDSGTRVRLDATCTASGFFMKLFHPLIAMAMRRHDSVQLELLRDRLEDGSGGS